MFPSLAAKRVLTRGLLLPCFALLMSCGGGGAGGGGGGDDPLRITLNRSTVSWTLLEGQTPTSESITGTATGSFDGTLYVGAVVENTGATNAINPNISISGTGTQATATVFPAADLPAGTYTGRILFLVCSDPLCNSRVGGTPLPVNFTVTIQPGVRATPGSLTRSVESGNVVVEDLAVTLGTGETAFTIGQTAAFVQISNPTANGFRVTLPSLPHGNYTANIPLLGSNGSRSSVPVAYTVTEPPGGQQMMSVNPRSVTLIAAEGGTSAAQTVQVSEASWRPGVRTSEIEYREGQGWLTIAAIAGGFSFSADATTLSSGTYTAVVVVGNNPLPEGIQEPVSGQIQSVFISLTVGPGFIQPPDVVQVIDSETQLSQLHGDVGIDLAGGPAVTWTASSDVPWLQITETGTTGSALAYTINQSFLSTAENFAEHVATITVNAPGTIISPMSFPVRVQRRLAEVSGVGARIQATGQPVTLVVAGRGFAAISNPAARVSTAGAAQTSVQRVSDTKLLVSFDSLSAGTHVVRVNNALGFTSATQNVLAVTPTPYAYSATPSGGPVIHLAVDHETDTLYGVRRGFQAALDQGTLVRYRPSGGSWAVDSPAIAAVDNVGVLRDGNVIVSTRPGTLRILDRDSLNQLFSLDVGCTGMPDSRSNMPVTVDGRVWLGQTQGFNCTSSTFPQHTRLGWFDPSTEAFQLFDQTPQPWFVQSFATGPSFIMSRNGERLIIDQESNQSFPSWIYLDATESVLRPVPTDGNIDEYRFESASASDDGSRILLDARFVKNGQFETIGAVSIPPYTVPFTDPALPAAAVLSTDGSRAYVLVYPVSFLAQPATPASPLPRVWVLDTSGDVGEGVTAIGYFELADYPSCLRGVDVGCDYRARAVISLDGNTLFFVGDERLVVTPIPPEGTLNDAFVGPNGGRQMKAQPWRVSTH